MLSFLLICLLHYQVMADSDENLRFDSLLQIVLVLMLAGKQILYIIDS